ncbi:MAG TPA: dienelactone hydrolase family protein [Balneolales bacterium]|nr:dienelactone hydrolase family protein [Balneolales bacterium]
MENTKTTIDHPEIKQVTINAGSVDLAGDLMIPEKCSGLVVFAHGSGSSRFSPRNQTVAEELNRSGLGTLLFDLLSPAENEIDELTCQYRFNIGLLGKRLTATLDWLTAQKETVGLNVGLFGASTGAAAAIIAAAERPESVKAIVSRGGRPDLAKLYLARVRAPLLLIVGGDDASVIAMNRSVLPDLRSGKRLEIIAGAGHLFEEPGKLEEMAVLARDWFLKWL